MLAEPAYLPAMRDLTRRNGALLIFDEVVSGFRVGLGGAQAMLGVTPDLTTFAKAMAAGFPIAAITGTDEAMASAIDGPVFQRRHLQRHTAIRRRGHRDHRLFADNCRYRLSAHAGTR